jgi:hypothetical protein
VICPPALPRRRESIDIDSADAPARKRARLSAQPDDVSLDSPSAESTPDPLIAPGISCLDEGPQVNGSIDPLEHSRAVNTDGEEHSKLHNPCRRHIIGQNHLDILYHHAQGDKIYCRLCQCVFASNSSCQHILMYHI